MKRLSILVLAVATIAFVASSCQKEGQFNPSKKITSAVVERLNDAGNMEISRKINYKWEKNLLVEETVDNGSVVTSRFTYDNKKRISEINTSNDIRLVYTYNGNKIATIEESHNGNLNRTYVFNHDDFGYITSIDVNVPEYKGTEPYTNCTVNPLFFLPTEIAADIQTTMLKYKATEYFYAFVYDINNNVEQMQINQVIYKYKYDNKRNPLYGFYDILSIDFDWIFAKHNVIERTVTNSDYPDDKQIVKYEYTYSGNYPLKQIVRDDKGAIRERTTFNY